MSVNLLSFNIRFDNPADKENAWPHRIEQVSSLIKNYQTDILGTQEGRGPQIKELEKVLIDKHVNLSLIDSHRDWIDERMYPCLFINLEIFDLVKSGDIWLSKTPDVPGSKDFESAFPRLCTWAQIVHKKSQEKIVVCNMHLDHLQSKTRLDQIKVFIREIQSIHDLSKENKLIIMGDFNESPTEDVRKEVNSSLTQLQDKWLEDKIKEESSYHKFKGHYHEGTRIDWILADKNFTPLEMKLIKDAIKDDQGINRYPSDHFPVLLRLDL